MNVSILAVTLFCVGTLSAVANPIQKGSPHLLTPEETALITQQIAAETMLPERARVTLMSAAINADGFVHACGFVSWIDGSGLYGPDRAFTGFIGKNVDGVPLFVSDIARTAHDDQVIAMVCEQYGASLTQPNQPPPGATPRQEPPPGVAKLIDVAGDLDSRCRGVEGANPSSTVCDERNAAFRAVNDFGWCYGKKDQFGYQHEWHVCGADSIGR